VGGVVHLDHHRVGIGVRADAAGAGERHRVRLDLPDVVVLGDAPDTVAFIPEDRLVLAEPGQLLMWVGAPEVTGEEIDLRHGDVASGFSR
jgi:hypothetical protein